MLLYPHPYIIYNYSQHHSHHRQHRNNVFTEMSTYSPLSTESSTNYTPTPTVDAIDAAITCTAQTNFIDGVELEGDFFSYCDNLTDERDDLCY